MQGLPYGINDLCSKPIKRGELIRCPVIGCDQWLKPPSRKPKYSGDVCSKHQIRVHRGGGYSYADYRRNLIVPVPDVEKILQCDFKFDTSRKRLSSSASEDTLSANVFISLFHHGLLHRVVHLITGIQTRREPRLYLWGIEVGTQYAEPWRLLQDAREQLEKDLLPPGRPQTEPDISLWAPHEYLIHIEAKNSSPNTYLRHDTTKLLDLTLGQFVEIYSRDDSRLIDWAEARRRDELPGQLLRNLQFADLQAKMDHDQTAPYVANLVREGYETSVCAPVLTLMKQDMQGSFEQLTWEAIWRLAKEHDVQPLCRYMEQKTLRFKPAFKIS